jgi:hypothetical protein
VSTGVEVGPPPLPPPPTAFRWRGYLISHHAAALPSGCVRCGDADGGHRREFVVYVPRFEAPNLHGKDLFLGAAAQLISSKTCTITGGFCASCRHDERGRGNAVWFMLLTGVAIIAAGFYFHLEAGFAGVLFIALGIGLLFRDADYLKSKYADGTAIWMTGAHPNFLATLPAVPDEHVPAPIATDAAARDEVL